VTDGYVSVEEEAFDLIRKNLGNANMFAFGIGSSVNRHLIEGMAHVGMGEPFILTKPETANAQAERFRKMIQSPVLTQVKLGFAGFQVYDVEPLSIPDVLAERPVLVFGKWRGNPKGTITLKGMTGEGSYSQTIKVEDYMAAKENAALKYLWARHRITLLSDYNKLRNDDKRVKEITNLGLDYHLLTAYTSFVAVDNEVRNVDGKYTSVKQPLPLPEGVSDYAVGSSGNYAAAPAMQMSKLMTGVSRKMENRLDEAKSTAQESEISKMKDKTQKVRIEQVIVEKGRSKEDIIKVAQTHLSAIEMCIAGSNFAGTIQVMLTINRDGTVKNVKITSDELKDEKRRQCLTAQIKQWQFPKMVDSRTVNVTITLNL
jgi:Ca-activated chloride channel family protein